MPSSESRMQHQRKKVCSRLNTGSVISDSKFGMIYSVMYEQLLSEFKRAHHQCAHCRVGIVEARSHIDCSVIGDLSRLRPGYQGIG